jgi:glycosyltransferase involved in cell wall biosynthesis
MKIAIDARKWRDYGIGTYVRNLVRHLAHLDRETTYFLLCDGADQSVLRDLADNFVPVVDESDGYGFREHVSIPRKLHTLGADLFHSPHYVLPLLCRRKSVVTIHDCIHLLFPQYLPNRLAYRYAKLMMGSAVKRSQLVFTVSEASRRDILRFYPDADPERLQVVPNAIDETLLADPGEEEMERVRERYQIRGRVVLYAGNIKPHKNLDRLISAFGLLKQHAGHEDVKLLIIGDEINKYPSLRRRVEAAGVRQDVRFFGFVPSRRCRALSAGLRIRVPVALRRVRPAPAGGDGVRDAGRDLENVVDPRGRGRRRGPGRSLRRGRHRGRPRARAGRSRAARDPNRARPRARAALQLGALRARHPCRLHARPGPRPRDRHGRAAFLKTATTTSTSATKTQRTQRQHRGSLCRSLCSWWLCGFRCRSVWRG